MPAKHKGDLLTLSGILIATVISLFFPSLSSAADFLQLPDGAKVDLATKCSVCGMVIGGKDAQGVTVTYKDGRAVGFAGVAATVFKDGHVVGFEGARCLFIYNSVPQKYGVDTKDISRQYVTDFVTKKMIPLSAAFLVLGSNVMGPMGYDMIPFVTKQEASTFAVEHDGKWIVQVHEVNRTQGEGLQEGQTDFSSKAEARPQEKLEKGVPGAREKLPTPERRYPVPRTGSSGHHMH